MEISDDLLISYLLDEVSPKERTQVEIWLKADPAHQQRLEQYRVIWDHSKFIGSDPAIDPHASLERFRQRFKEWSLITNSSNVVPIKRSYALLKIAASLFLLAGGAWWFWLYEPGHKVITSIAHMKGQRDTLSDGSIITLNRSAVLHYPASFPDELREVTLEKGEAFFNIKHEAKKPFILHAGKADIQVLGTSFNVKHGDKGVEVIVETGLVSVTEAGRTIPVKPGEKVVLLKNGKSPVKTFHAGRLYQYYLTKEFVADDTPLSELVAVLNEAYGSHIVIGNEKLKMLPLNTTFKDESLEDILDIISRTFSIKVIKTPHTIILK